MSSNSKSSGTSRPPSASAQQQSGRTTRASNGAESGSRPSTPVQGGGNPQSQTTPPAAAKGSAPPSPIVLSRIAEKKELVSLNDRLAQILDRQRRADRENSELKTTITEIQSSHSKSISVQQANFDSERLKLRKQVEDERKERTRLHSGFTNLSKDLEATNHKLTKKCDDLVKAEAQLVTFGAKLSAFEAEAKKTAAEKEKLAKEKAELGEELTGTKAEVAELRKTCAETIAKSKEIEDRWKNDVENMKRGHEFQIMQKEASLTEVRTEMKKIQEDNQQEYQTALSDGLKQNREEAEARLEEYKKQLEHSYVGKTVELQNAALRLQGIVSAKAAELAAVELKCSSQLTKITELEGEKATLQQSLVDAKVKSSQDLAKFNIEKKDLEKAIKLLEDDKQKKREEYEDLLGEKISLDNELAQYRFLLDGEEKRWASKRPLEQENSSPAPNDSTSASTTNTSKRRRN